MKFEAPPRLLLHWSANGNRIQAFETTGILAAPLLSWAFPVSTALWFLTFKALDRLSGRAGSNFDSIIFAPFHTPGCQDTQSKDHLEREQAAGLHGEGRVALMSSPKFTIYVFTSRRGPSGIYLAPPTCYCLGRKLSHRTEVLMLQK